MTTCVYCERNAGEIVAAGDAPTEDDALKFVVINDSQVLLCPNCRSKYALAFADDIDAILSAPIDFPPGVTAVEHCCPELQFQGLSDEASTSILLMERKGDYYVATCPHCDVTIRSLAEDDDL